MVVALVPSTGSRDGVAVAQSWAHASLSPGATVPSRVTEAAVPARMLVGLTPAIARALVFVLQQTHLKASVHCTGLVPARCVLKYKCPLEGCHQQPLGRSYASCKAAGAAVPGMCGCRPATAEHSVWFATGCGQVGP